MAACRAPHPDPDATVPPLPTAAVAGNKGVPCGPLGCLQYESASDAFLDAIADDPRVVAVGEAHAQKGATAPSSAKRFTDELLPLLAGRASDLVVELMAPPVGCAAKTQEVRRKQTVVTSRQEEGDQGEYVAMGERARALGIVPDLLHPTCADMDAIRNADAGAVEASLETIARLTTSKVEVLVDRREKLVVTYGGVLHNARLPARGREAWSFGPALDAYVKGRYVEVDLFVPEFIEDTDTWRAQDWYAYYDRSKLGVKVTMFRPAERRYVIIFPLASRAQALEDH